jgi:flagellar basal-body rod protein FlgF
VAGLYDNVAALGALTRRYDSLTQDIANAATPGYRGRAIADQSFETELTGQERLAATLDVDQRPGVMQSTGDMLDVALAGAGFFVAEGAGGTPMLTRRGDLAVQNGFLALRSGPKILGAGGPIAIPEDAAVSIADDGSVIADGAPIGQLRLAKGEGLAPRGQGLYSATTITNLTGTEAPRIQSGVREASNVNMPHAMAELISAQRLYGANLGAIKKQDQVDERLLRMRPV